MNHMRAKNVQSNSANTVSDKTQIEPRLSTHLVLLFRYTPILYLLCARVGKCKQNEPIFVLRKQNIRIGNKATIRGPVNPLAVKLKALDFMDPVNSKITQITYKVNNKQLPDSIQATVQLQDGKYDLRGTPAPACANKR